MLKKFVIFNVACAAAFVLASSTAGAATYSFVVSGQQGNLNNDCSGYFGSGFDNCNVKIDGTDLSGPLSLNGIMMTGPVPVVP